MIHGQPRAHPPCSREPPRLGSLTLVLPSAELSLSRGSHLVLSSTLPSHHPTLKPTTLLILDLDWRGQLQLSVVLDRLGPRLEGPEPRWQTRGLRDVLGLRPLIPSGRLERSASVGLLGLGCVGVADDVWVHDELVVDCHLMVEAIDIAIQK